MSLLVAATLAPLAKYYEQSDVVEVRMVKPGEVILERRGDRLERIQDAELSMNAVIEICQCLANYKDLIFHQDDEPNLATVLPGDHRFDCLVGASVVGEVSMTIRCKHEYQVYLEDYGLGQDAIAYIQQALDDSWNMVISGGTKTGKTTFLNNLLSRLDRHVRVISVEDTPELETAEFWNGVSLLAAREASQSGGQRTWAQLFNHKMRSSPDRIVFGEISVSNAQPALTALNTGAQGFMCTVHSDGPELVPQRFADNIQSSGLNMGNVKEYMTRVVDLVVQIRLDQRTGGRYISDLWEMKNNHYVMKNGIFLGPKKAAA